MYTKKRIFAKLVAVLGWALLAGACRGGRTPAPAIPEKAETPQPPPAPTVTLVAEPNNIQSGDSTTLSWTSQNATDLDLVPGVGNVQAMGSTSVTLKDSTTFTLTATGPGGTGSATARVTVVVLPPAAQRGGPVVDDVPFDVQVARNIKDAYFDFDKASVRADAGQNLTADAAFLKAHPDVKFTMEGHCDDRGSEEYNLGLGDRRANAAKEFLINSGVAADQVSTISYGKAQPVCTEQMEDCWQKNRRAHLHLGGEPK